MSLSMSFSMDIKENISQERTTPCCQRAQTYAMLLGCNRLTSEEIRMTSESLATVKCFSQLIDKMSAVAVEISVTKGGYHAQIIGEDAQKVLRDFYIDSSALNLRLSRANIENECCVGAFVRGMFLTCGYAADPDKGYLLEFVTRHRQFAMDFSALLSECDCAPAIRTRQSKYVLYYKSSEKILDLLGLIGASKNSFDIINKKIEREFKNRANRIVNTDSANIKKIAIAAARQNLAIEKLEKDGTLLHMSQEMQDIAKLRKDNPESSLGELAELSGLSRSKIDRALRKLVEKAI